MSKIKQREPTLVLSQADLTRIKSHLEPSKDEKQEKARMAHEERKRLHEMSVNQVKSWTNTVLGQRQANLKARKLKEELEERQRQQVDVEEAKLQADKRKQAIEKAKMQQYYETEKIRKFHSALMLSETLYVREKQIEYKESLRLAQLNREKGEVMEYIWGPDDDNKLMEQRKRKKDVSDFQKSQIEKRKIAKEKQKEDLRKDEEEELARNFESFRLEREKIRFEKNKKIAIERDNHERQLEQKKEFEEIELTRQEEENEANRAFSEKKKHFSKMVALKEIQMIKQKQNNLEKMSENISWFGDKHKKSHEDDRVQQFLDEQEKMFARKLKDEEDKKLKYKETLKKQFDEQEETKRKNKENQMKEEMKYIEDEARVSDEHFKKDEENKKKKLYEAKQLSDHHHKQIEEKKMKVQHEEKEKMEQKHLRKYLDEKDNNLFDDYSSGVIKRLEQQGRNADILKRMISRDIDWRRFTSVE